MPTQAHHQDFWWQLECVLTAEQAEYLSEALLEEDDILAITMSDEHANTPDEIAMYGEPGMMSTQTAWQSSKLQILIAQDQNPGLWQQRIASLLAIDLLHISVTQVPTQDWVRATQQQFAPIVIPPHLAIVPTWHDLPEGIAHTIRLDPGLAFGTGSHPTTQLCLEWLCANQAHLANFDVMDYGCGSGILAIAAARLGAKSVDATDIDPNAVQSTADNAAYNDVELDTGLPEVFMGQHYEVVLANILANPLQVLAPMLCEKVNTHGFLVLSGILVEQVELLTACYAPWIPLTVWQEKDGWVCLVGQKNEGGEISLSKNDDSLGSIPTIMKKQVK